MATPANTPLPRCSRLHLALLVAITFLGGLNRILVAAQRPLWFDEVFSVYSSQVTSYGDLLRWKNEDPNQPPLSFLLMKGSATSLGSWDPWAVRLIPVIAGVLCIPSVFLIGKALGSPRLGIWAAAVAAFDPLLVEQSCTARMFSLLCLGETLTLYLLVMTVATNFSLRYCLGLGLILGASLWMNQLAWVGWSAAAATLAVRLAQVYFSRTQRSNFLRACWGAGTAFFISVLIGLPAIDDMLTKRLDQAGSAVPPSFRQIMSDIYHSLVHLEPVPYVWILVVAAALAGIVWLWLRQGAVVIPLIAMGILSFVFAVFLRQRHPFFAPRYLTPLLPVVWVGLATFPALLRPRIVSVVAQVLLAALLLFHARHCADLTTAWKTKYEFLVSQEVANLRDKIPEGDRVVFARRNCFVFGRYYHLPVDMELEDQLLLDGRIHPSKKTALRSSSNATWLVAARLKKDKHVERGRKCLEKLARAYDVSVSAEEVRKHLRRFRFCVVRVSVGGIEYSSQDLKGRHKTEKPDAEEPAESP